LNGRLTRDKPLKHEGPLVGWRVCFRALFGPPGFQESLHRSAGFRAETAELLLGQQLLEPDARQLEHGDRAPRVIKGVGQFLVPSPQQLENGQVSLMVAPPGVGTELADFGKHVLAEAVESEWLKLAEQLPV